jgi:hypothetical protein
MGSMTVVEIARQAELLAPEDQLYLIARLADKARHTYRQTPPRRKWHDICGAAPYPLTGEDAQATMSRSRQEDDAARQQRWKRNWNSNQLKIVFGAS